MQSYPSAFWDAKHGDYLKTDWINKPSIFVKQVIKYFPNKSKVLELGAGQGQDSRFFATQGFDVLSTDFSKTAIDLSREKAKEANLNLEFKVMDISKKFPFKSNEFDVVYSHMALHYWDEAETQKILKEIKRVLKREGIFACLLNTQRDPELKEFKKIGNNLYRDPSGISKSYFTAEYFKNFVDKDYKIVILDDIGETYKDKYHNLVRFVGQKK
jgi:ubiquinone/menaquinone biosynthesis C-methylase UbiE